MGIGFPLRVVNIFWNEIMVTVVQHCVCTKCHWSGHFKMVKIINFITIQIKIYGMG